VKVALRDSPPLFLMAARFLIAGLLLLVALRALGYALPAGLSAWRPIVLLGLFNNALYLGVTAVAFQELSAGLGAVLASTNPLMLALVAPWALGERLTTRKAAGLALSYTGVAWIMWDRIGRDNRPRAIVLFMCALAFLVAGTILFKKLSFKPDLLVLNAGQLVSGGVFLIVPSLLVEPVSSVRATPALVASLAWLVVGVSWGAMMFWFWLLRHGDATRASAWFFLNPVIGLVLAAVLLGEPLAVSDLFGAVGVAVGIWLVQRS